MPILKKSEIKLPVVPAEAVMVESMGGEVLVRSISVTDKLDRFAAWEADKSGRHHIWLLLERAVVDADRVPIMTAEQWEDYSRCSPQHAGDVALLHSAARRISGLDEKENEKKSETLTSG